MAALPLSFSAGLASLQQTAALSTIHCAHAHLARLDSAAVCTFTAACTAKGARAWPALISAAEWQDVCSCSSPRPLPGSGIQRCDFPAFLLETKAEQVHGEQVKRRQKKAAALSCQKALFGEKKNPFQSRSPEVRRATVAKFCCSNQ